MKEKPGNPYLPIVTLEQVTAYRKNNPSTHTPSRLVNAVCEAFETLGLSSRTPIADYLGVSTKDLTSALRLETGYSLTEIRVAIARHRLATIKAEHPNWNTDQMARSLGFYDRSTLFRLLGEKSYDKEVAKFRHWQ